MTDMEDYVTFEQAQRLKKLGFDWKCNHYYQDNDQSLHINFYENFNKHSKLNTEDEKLIKVTLYSAPTMSQAQKWLREKHNTIILVDTYFKNYKDGDYSKAEFEYVIVYMNFNATRKGSSKDDKLFESYEQALSAGIDKALELLK